MATLPGSIKSRIMPQSVLWSLILVEQSPSSCLGTPSASSCLCTWDNDLFHPAMESHLRILHGGAYSSFQKMQSPPSCFRLSSASSHQRASSPTPCLGTVSLILPGRMVPFILQGTANSVILPRRTKSFSSWQKPPSPAFYLRAPFLSSCLAVQCPSSCFRGLYRHFALGEPYLSSCLGGWSPSPS